MQAAASRLLELRKSIGFTQLKMAKTLGISQSSLNRYEHDNALIPDTVFLAYADYFDVSLDYIFGRTDNPEGKLFSGQPKIGEDNEELRQFIEMCFDPKSKMSDRLKDTLYKMMTGDEQS